MKEEKKDNGTYKLKVSQKAIVYDPRENKFLLLKIADIFRGNKYYMTYGPWELAGGRVEEQENLENAFSREISEEAGDIKFNIHGVVDIVKISFPEAETIFVGFLIEYLGGKIELSNEHQDFRWETAEDIKKSKEYKPWLKNFIEKAEKLINLEKSFDSYKRVQADLENYRKLQEKKMADFRQYANLDMIYQILPVLDNFESSLEHIPEDQKDGGWVQGILYIKKQLEDVLKNNGVEEIVIKVGDKFDHNLMEAASGSKEEGTNVEKVIQKGYKMGDRVIRAGKVIVQ